MSLFYCQKIVKKCKKTLLYYHLRVFTERNKGVRKLRRQALKLLSSQARALARANFIEEIVLGVVTKKAEIIMQIYTEEAFAQLLACSYPRFDGTKYESSVSDEYYIPEEECVHWANFFEEGLQSSAGNARYNEVLALAFPEKEWLEVQKIKKNHLKTVKGVKNDRTNNKRVQRNRA